MKTQRATLTGQASPVTLNLARTGMPGADSIYDAKRVVRRGRRQFRIVRTTEVDSYEKTPTAMAMRRALAGRTVPLGAVLAAAMKKKPTGDQFAGTARKAAKLSISAALAQTFSDLKAVIESLVTDDKVVAHKPKIATTASSRRVAEENRNIKVKAFLYAASREADNDFHLIIGRAVTKTPEMYMTAELSGLPSANSPASPALTSARKAFKTFFGTKLSGETYDFYDPPIPVTLEGSLFFDITHATGQRPGPASLKSRMPTIWEVHSITGITLG